MLLAAVEREAIELGQHNDDHAVRTRLVAALEHLGELLLDHLEFEEASLESTLGRMSSWTG